MFIAEPGAEGKHLKETDPTIRRKDPSRSRESDAPLPEPSSGPRGIRFPEEGRPGSRGPHEGWPPQVSGFQARKVCWAPAGAVSLPSPSVVSPQRGRCLPSHAQEAFMIQLQVWLASELDLKNYFNRSYACVCLTRSVVQWCLGKRTTPLFPEAV